MHHDSEEEHVLSSPGVNSVDITPIYSNSVPEMKALMKVSRDCHQYLAVKSFNSRVFDDNGMPLKWWVTVDNDVMTNWAAPTGIYGCQCCMTGGR